MTKIVNNCNPRMSKATSFVNLVQQAHIKKISVKIRAVKLAIQLLILVPLLVASAFLCAEETAYSTEPENQCEKSNTCIEKSNWQIGVAIGLGAKSNPLVDGDALPQIILLDIAWYGENAYFDNGELGYKFIQTETAGLESYVTLDRERAFFSFWHPNNIVIAGSALSPTVPSSDETEQETEISIRQIERRDWAVNAGLRMHLYGDDSEFTLSAETDISSVHKGYKVAMTYQHHWVGEDWSLMIRPSLIWKSDNLINYYYGLSDQDVFVHSQSYQAKGGFQPAISVLYTQQINADWQWIVNASYQKLHSSMVNSPIVRRDNVSSLFIGAGYRF